MFRPISGQIARHQIGQSEYITQKRIYNTMTKSAKSQTIIYKKTKRKTND